MTAQDRDAARDDAAEMMEELGRQDLEIDRAIDAAEKPRSLMTLGELMIESLMETPEFWAAFQRVKLDSADSGNYEGERVVIVVAKGEHADRLAEAYDRG